MSALSEPRKPDCDVCDWATAYHYAYELNLCEADLEIVNKVAQAERERIIKLLEADSVGYCSCKWGETALDSGEFVEVQEFICEPHRYIALIKGEQK